jgi:hypothetical protein
MSETIPLGGGTVPGATDKPIKPHRSISQVTSLLGCGEAYRRRYVEKEKYPWGVSALIGSGMHKGAEVNFKQKLVTHEDLPVKDIVDAAVAGFEERLEKDDVAIDKGENRELVIAAGKVKVQNFAAAFATMQAPDYQPVATEQKFRIEVPRGTHDIVGVIDLVAILKRLGPGQRVRDFKTAGRKKSTVDEADSLQLTCYDAGHRSIFGFAPEDVGLDVLIQGPKSKGAQRQELVGSRDAEDFRVLANVLNVMDHAIKTGTFLPNGRGTWKCAAKWCEFYTRGCPYVNADKLQQIGDKQGEDAE